VQVVEQAAELGVGADVADVAVMQSKPPSMSIWSTEMSMTTSAACSARSELVQVPLVVLKVSLARGRAEVDVVKVPVDSRLVAACFLSTRVNAQRLGAAAGHGLGLRDGDGRIVAGGADRLEEDDGAAGVALHRDVVGDRAGVGVEGDRDDARDERPLFEDVLVERHGSDSFVGMAASRDGAWRSGNGAARSGAGRNQTLSAPAARRPRTARCSSRSAG
jgi:hypothetical protein